LTASSPPVHSGLIWQGVAQGIPMNEPHSKAAEALDSLAIDHEIIPCESESAYSAEFCREYGYPQETSATPSLSHPSEGRRCTAPVWWLDVNHVVKRLLGASRLSFASADETRELTGMEIGGDTVFGSPADLPLYAYVALKSQPYIVVGSGNRTSRVRMAPGELSKTPN